ncbi:hypothetical protein BWQ96_01888 [Gracilariopsis chorda]|uniref:AIG1-type G domain-containing protein n=1 Tax=Gracilariopsis chorda TaxID=448386 RepID=A0A2V3J217_9FLOR|nr:hypothetical protein BWQ96_01888 [Gracilariopsis chorda]|eukprot:PXF48428.1 hypothetical protein BWQ96_01888 [Gracilariopsis chorda]
MKSLKHQAATPGRRTDLSVCQNCDRSQGEETKEKSTSSDSQTLSVVSDTEHSQVLPNSETKAPTRVIVIGNPGVGKSTIQNTLLQKTVFESGISLGGGLTKSTATCTKGDLTFVDTPGLDDLYNRRTAAKEISAALRGPSTVKMVFVTALEAGRVRSADVCTLQTIVTALREVVGDMTRKYTLIINKCEDSLAQTLTKKDSLELRASVLGPYFAVEEAKQVEIIRAETSIRGKSGTLLNRQAAERLRGLIERAPTIDLPAEPVVRLKLKTYEKNAQQIDEEMRRFYKGSAQNEKISNKRAARNEQKTQFYPQPCVGDEANMERFKARMSHYSNRRGAQKRKWWAEVFGGMFNTP